MPNQEHFTSAADCLGPGVVAVSEDTDCPSLCCCFGLHLASGHSAITFQRFSVLGGKHFSMLTRAATLVKLTSMQDAILYRNTNGFHGHVC